MVSPAETLAASINLSTFSKATELKSRIWFTLLALIIYRLGTYIPVPGIDPVSLGEIFKRHGGGVLGMFDMFAGGALKRMTVFALGVMPYITASIIVQLLSAIVPSFEALKKEGSSGQMRLNQYSRYLTVVFAIVQSYALAVGLENMMGSSGSAVILPGFFFRLSTMITLTGGTVFLMWLGEQITARGIGNGVSLIIYAGIIANLPNAMAQTLELGRTGALSTWFILFVLVLIVAILAMCVFFERAQRRILVNYPKRQVGNKIYGGEASHMPLKLNTSGRHSADFRQFAVVVSLDAGQLYRRSAEGRLSRGCGDAAWPRQAAVHGALRGVDHLFLVLLYGGGVQPRRNGGQPEEVRRLCAGDSSGQEYG